MRPWWSISATQICSGSGLGDGGDDGSGAPAGGVGEHHAAPRRLGDGLDEDGRAVVVQRFDGGGELGSVGDGPHVADDPELPDRPVPAIK